MLLTPVEGLWSVAVSVFHATQHLLFNNTSRPWYKPFKLGPNTKKSLAYFYWDETISITLPFDGRVIIGLLCNLREIDRLVPHLEMTSVGVNICQLLVKACQIPSQIIVK